MSSPFPSLSRQRPGPRVRWTLLAACLWAAMALGQTESGQPAVGQPNLGQPAVGQPTLRELRVCADPDNLPYSHQDLSGFENRIAALVAADMGARLRYEWLPQ